MEHWSREETEEMRGKFEDEEKIPFSWRGIGNCMPLPDIINMTEDEARKKWCPMGITEHQGKTVNRSIPNGQGITNCIASECACWRETRREVTEHFQDKYAEACSSGDLERIRAMESELEIWRMSVGYCGLAGRP